ncbi:Uma2 family endonuclease [Aeoliella sp. SH292]|uniref:Uma2 family endonuclease n=1 Tax=Aeoliella sp. SH292 TaxID=3454464 RepID=UPI003F9E96F0
MSTANFSTSAYLPDFPAIGGSSGIGPYRAADYWKLPEGEPIELIRGHYVMSPAPNFLHQAISLLLSEMVLRASRKGGGSGVASPIDVHLSDDTVVQPDLVYVAKGRRTIIGRHVTGPPDLVVEIVSESRASRDRRHKLAIYAEHGVPEYWIVDPAEQHIEFLLLAGDRYQVEPMTGDAYTSPRLPEVTLELAVFWGEVRRLVEG